MRSSDQGRPWTQEMVIVHRVFRREFRLLAGQIVKTDPADLAQVRRLADHCAFGLGMLEHHHSGEDELVWPKLRARCQLQADLVKRMEDQHHRIAGIVQHAEQLLATWRAAPSQSKGEPLAAVLGELTEALDEHLGEEEAQILPLIEEHLTVEEWAEVGQRGLKGISPPKRLFALGLLLEEATPSEQARFLQLVPAVPRAVYTTLGRRQFAKQIARIRAR
jgi:hemerythrin-like domain-containing protein